MWGDTVEVVSCDMRKWDAPEKADILVSELLGSFSDNELSPECLDGAQRFLKGKPVVWSASRLGVRVTSIWKLAISCLRELLCWLCLSQMEWVEGRGGIWQNSQEICFLCKKDDFHLFVCQCVDFFTFIHYLRFFTIVDLANLVLFSMFAYRTGFSVKLKWRESYSHVRLFDTKIALSTYD